MCVSGSCRTPTLKPLNESPQLEDSNKTLTKDVENLSKEKAELNNKLRIQEEGSAKTQLS